MSLAYVRSLSNLLKQPLQDIIDPKIVDVKNPLYRAKYFGELARGMVRRHLPRLNTAVGPAVAHVTFSDLDIQDWQQFVGKSVQDIESPLTYYNSAGAICLFKILSDIRINFTTILHLRASLEVTAPVESVTPNSIYTIRMELSDVIPRKGQCILVMSTDLLDERHRVLRRHKDYWFVKKCPAEFLVHVTSADPVLAEEFRGLSKRESTWATWGKDGLKKRQHRLPLNAGKEYGRISGDHNVIHTTHWGARLCGQKRPFLQGFGLMNLTLHHATQAQGKTPHSIVITFARPALVDQNLDLYFGGNSFEICDERKQLVAYGQLG